jgi:hypothetical protein
VEQQPQYGAASDPGPSLKNLLRIGGASFMLASLLYVWAFVAQLLLPAARLTSEAGLLQFIATYRPYFLLSYALFTAANALSIVGVLAIYAVTRASDKSHAVLGAGTLTIGLATTLLSSTTPALIALSDGYSSAASAADQQALATAALAVSAANNPVIASAFIGVGVIFVSLAMMKGPFGRVLAYMGLVVGAFNIIRALPLLAGYSFLTGLVFVGVSSLWILGVGRVVYKEA